MNDMLLAALAYFEEERLIFPLSSKGKPLVKWGGITTPDYDQVTSWWEEFPGAGIGVALGRRSDLWLLDIDIPSPGKPNRDNGVESIISLTEKHGPMPKTMSSRSPSGGFHLWFTYPEIGEIRNSASELGPGIDVKGSRGMGILPPTKVDRGAYTLISEKEPIRAPKWLETLALATPPETAPHRSLPQLPPHRLGTSPYGDAAISRAVSTVCGAPEGSRHKTLNAVAYSIGRLVGGAEIDLDEALTALRIAGENCGLKINDVRVTVRDAITAGMRDPKTAPCQ